MKILRATHPLLLSLLSPCKAYSMQALFLKKICLLLLCLFAFSVRPSFAEGVLPICVPEDNPPYAFVDDDGVRRGFDIAVLEAMQLPYSLVFIPADYATSLVMLEEGTCRMLLSSRMITSPLKARFIASAPHLEADLHALVLQHSPLDENEDLSSSIVGVLKGSDAEKYAFSVLKNSTIIALKNENSLVHLLFNGEIEAILGNELLLKTIMQNFENMQILEPPIKEQDYCYIFSKREHELRDVVNEKVQQLEAKGTLDTLYVQWFGDSSPTSAQHKEQEQP